MDEPTAEEGQDELSGLTNPLVMTPSKFLTDYSGRRRECEDPPLTAWYRLTSPRLPGTFIDMGIQPTRDEHDQETS